MRFSEFKSTIFEAYFPTDFPVLKSGSRGDSVKRYQEALTKIVDVDIAIDGIFGPATVAATKQAQQALGVTADGVVGPKTLNAMNRALETGTVSSASSNIARTKSTEDKPLSQVLKSGKGFNVVKTQDGDVQKRVGTRSWRNNNPGNLEFGGFARSKGAVGTDGRFAIFPTADQGFAAKRDLLFGTAKYSNLTLRDAMYKYAPGNENDTEAYLSYVARQVGVDANTPLSRFTEDQRDKLIQAMATYEGYKIGEIRPVTPADVT